MTHMRVDGDEAILVLSGSVRVAIAGREVTLDAGDSVHFRCDQPHSIRNGSAVAMAEVALAVDRRLTPSLRRQLDRASAA